MFILQGNLVSPFVLFCGFFFWVCVCVSTLCPSFHLNFAHFAAFFYTHFAWNCGFWFFFFWGGGGTVVPVPSCSSLCMPMDQTKWYMNLYLKLVNDCWVRIYTIHHFPVATFTHTKNWANIIPKTHSILIVFAAMLNSAYFIWVILWSCGRNHRWKLESMCTRSSALHSSFFLSSFSFGKTSSSSDTQRPVFSKVTNFSEWLTMEFSYPVLWNTTCSQRSLHFIDYRS